MAILSDPFSLRCSLCTISNSYTLLSAALCATIVPILHFYSNLFQCNVCSIYITLHIPTYIGAWRSSRCIAHFCQIIHLPTLFGFYEYHVHEHSGTATISVGAGLIRTCTADADPKYNRWLGHNTSEHNNYHGHVHCSERANQNRFSFISNDGQQY